MTTSSRSSQAESHSRISSPGTQTGRIDRLVVFAHQEIELRALDLYELIIAIGGIGSGKTTSLVLWLLWLMKRGDFSQVHALFALTTASLRSITEVIDKMLDRIPWVRNRERTISTRPPKEWQEDWDRRGVVVPPRKDRYENIRVWPSGLHLLLGTVHNRSYEQHRGAEWGSFAGEEVGLQGFTSDAFDFLDERVRCGQSGDGYDCSQPPLNHRHLKILHTNPPENPDHWILGMLDSLEREASSLPGAVPFKEGSAEYPNLIRGIGRAILIPSQTTDNTRLPKAYAASKVARLDNETASRRLGGVITRTKAGRVYAAYSNLNEIDTFDYDPDRTLWISLDWNRNPAAGTFHHPLVPGEFPSEHARPGIEHIGTFGTFFHVGGINAEDVCAMLLTGERGNQSNLPTSCLTCRKEDCIDPQHRHGWAGLLRHRTRVIFYGDATATYDRMTENEWQIAERIIGGALKRRYRLEISEKRNPSVALSVFALAAKCGNNHDHLISYWNHPRNDELRQDFLTNVWSKDGRHIQKYGYRPGSSSKMYQRTHAADTVRYIVDHRYPLGEDPDPRSETPKVIRSQRESDPSFI